MQKSSTYQLWTLNPTGGFLETEIHLDPSAREYSLRLRALPGAGAIHLAVSGPGGVCLRAEIPADENESVLVQLERLDLHPSGPNLTATSPGRHVLTLAPDERYAAPPPLRIAPPGSPLDLALVVDGTARLAPKGASGTSEDPSGPLLGDPEAWAARAHRLTSFVDTLRPHYSDVRLAACAFGDEPPSPAKAADLQPRYLLHPEASEIRLETLSSQRLSDLLLALPPTSGGDFVDAVADAFAACRRLRWRPEARKLLVLFGDSPGHSALHPPPPGADALVRSRDVDHEALRLHTEEGVEILTVYLEPSAPGWQEIDFKRRLVEFARGQYRRLASRPEMAVEASQLEVPEEAASLAETVAGQAGVLGFGSSWGQITKPSV